MAEGHDDTQRRGSFTSAPPPSRFLARQTPPLAATDDRMRSNHPSPPLRTLNEVYIGVCTESSCRYHGNFVAGRWPLPPRWFYLENL